MTTKREKPLFKHFHDDGYNFHLFQTFSLINKMLGKTYREITVLRPIYISVSNFDKFDKGAFVKLILQL